jgi:hypothetical protein
VFPGRYEARHSACRKLRARTAQHEDHRALIDAGELQTLINAGINVGIIYEMDGGSPEFGGTSRRDRRRTG